VEQDDPTGRRIRDKVFNRGWEQRIVWWMRSLIFPAKTKHHLDQIIPVLKVVITQNVTVFIVFATLRRITPLLHGSVSLS